MKKSIFGKKIAIKMKLLASVALVSVSLCAVKSAVAAELSLHNYDFNGDGMFGGGVVRGYDNLIDVGVGTTAGGLVITDITATTMYGEPALKVFGRSPLWSNVVIPELTSSPYIMNWGGYTDPRHPDRIMYAYQLFIHNVCDDYPGFDSPLTVHVDGFVPAQEIRMLTCPL